MFTAAEIISSVSFFAKEIHLVGKQLHVGWVFDRGGHRIKRLHRVKEFSLCKHQSVCVLGYLVRDKCKDVFITTFFS